MAAVKAIYPLAVAPLAVAIDKISAGIVDFMVQHQDKGPLIANISVIVNEIRIIIAPLLFPNRVTYDSVKEVLQTLQTALTRTDRHLRAWEKRLTRRFVAFVNPSALTSELREDREQLIHQCILLLVAIQVGDHMGKHRLLLPTADDDTSTLPEYSKVAPSRRPSISQIHNSDSKSILKPTFPLLIWINDDLKKKKRHIAYASKCGVTVVQLGSTSAAKTWIRVNKDYLKKNDGPKNFRFISDQVRRKVDSKGVLRKDKQAGNEITKFIRDEGLKAPILICTSKRQIGSTRYVQSYPNTGSLTGSDKKVLYEYLESLGARRKGDMGWMKFGG